MLFFHTGLQWKPVPKGVFKYLSLGPTPTWHPPLSLGTIKINNYRITPPVPWVPWLLEPSGILTPPRTPSPVSLPLFPPTSIWMYNHLSNHLLHQRYCSSLLPFTAKCFSTLHSIHASDHLGSSPRKPSSLLFGSYLVLSPEPIKALLKYFPLLLLWLEQHPASWLKVKSQSHKYHPMNPRRKYWCLPG